MQRLTLAIPIASFSPGESFHVFANADRHGMTLVAIDYDRPITGDAARPFWRLTAVPAGWGQLPWGSGPWGGVPAETPPDETVDTPALFFGWYLFAVVTYDQVGNPSDGTPVEFRAFVNSGPRPPKRLRHTSSVNGRPVFSFTGSPQLAA